MTSSSHRIQSLDVLRGVAVVVMIVGHSVDAVLSPEARMTDLFRAYDTARGFTAPLFLFISGMAFMFATERRWAEFRTFSPPAARRFARAALLLLIGYALHVPFFSFRKMTGGAAAGELAALFQVDVLHCVAVTLLLLQGIVMLSRTPWQGARRAAAVAAGIVLLGPVVWSVDFSGVLPPFITPYLNASQPSIFPLLPYAAYMLLGAAAGHFLLSARAAGNEDRFWGVVLTAACGVAAAGILISLLPVSMYPAHDWWKVSPAIVAVRVFVVAVVSAAFFRMRQLPDFITRPSVMLGQASLLIYTVHLVMVYGSAANDGLMQSIGQRLSVIGSIGVAAGVLLSMVVLVHILQYVKERHPERIRTAGAFAAVMLFYAFLTKPY